AGPSIVTSVAEPSRSSAPAIQRAPETRSGTHVAPAPIRPAAPAVSPGATPRGERRAPDASRERAKSRRERRHGKSGDDRSHANSGSGSSSSGSGSSGSGSSDSSGHGSGSSGSGSSGSS